MAKMRFEDECSEPCPALTENFIPGTEEINNLENSRLPVDGDGMMSVVSLTVRP